MARDGADLPLVLSVRGGTETFWSSQLQKAMASRSRPWASPRKEKGMRSESPEDGGVPQAPLTLPHPEQLLRRPGKEISYPE